MIKTFLWAGIIALLTPLALQAKEEKYTIRVEVDGLSDTTVFMAYYYGSGQYYRDTARFDANGIAVFSKNDSLEHGMYSIMLPKTKLFDFMVDVQELSFKTDTADYLNNMKIKGGKENQIFFNYLKYLHTKQDEASQLKSASKTANETTQEEIAEQLKKLDEEVSEYLINFHTKNEGSLPSNFVKALDYPVVPDAPVLADGSIDSTFELRYFKKHFFDNIDFTDGRLVRTSVFHEKLEYYLNKLNYQVADSLIEAADVVLGKSEANPALFRYALSYMTSKYERAEKMGMDAVFVHLGKNYFMKGKAEPWFKEEQLKKLAERVNALDPLLIGKKAPNIVVKDTAMKNFLQLKDIKSPYTIVYIWSPECGHCKKATPKLKKVYEKYKSQGLEVFAVGNDFENEEWLRFIQKHKLDWINGSDGGDFTSNFRTLYDVYSTPQTYLLDKDKKILAKKVSIESMEGILEYYLNKDKEEKEN